MMLNVYRKYKCISDFWDEKTDALCSVKRTINLADVSNYEEWVDMDHSDGVARTVLFFNNNSMPINARVPFDVFDKVYDDFMTEIGVLDSRSVKKKRIYNGPMKFVFDLTKQYTVIHAYPEGYSFNGKTVEQVKDANLFSSVTVMN